MTHTRLQENAFDLSEWNILQSSRISFRECLPEILQNDSPEFGLQCVFRFSVLVNFQLGPQLSSTALLSPTHVLDALGPLSLVTIPLG